MSYDELQGQTERESCIVKVWSHCNTGCRYFQFEQLFRWSTPSNESIFNG